MTDPYFTLRVTLTFFPFFYYVYKVLKSSKQTPEKQYSHNMLRLATNALFVSIGESCLADFNLIQIPIFRIVGTMLTGYGITLMYFTLDRIFNGNQRSIIFTTHFILSTLEMITEMLIDTTLTNNFGSFFHQHPFTRETNYYIRYSITILSLFRMQSLIVYLLWKNITKQRGDILYTIRRYVGMIGFALPATSSLLSIYNLLLTIPYERLYIESIYSFCNFISLIGNIMLISAILPQKIFKKIFSPIVKTVELIERIQTRFAHHLYISIVPGVHINNIKLSDPEIEIPDAREFIWSNTEHSKPLTPYTEAKLLIYLFNNKITYDKPGEHNAPPPEYQSQQHTLSVAKKLIWLFYLNQVKQLSTLPIRFLNTQRGQNTQ